MKLPHLTLGVSLLFVAGDLFGQTNQARLFLPFLDRESQSNVVVSVGFNVEQACPLEFSNVLSNTNLFTPEQQKLIKEVLVKYQNVTTNSGPAGTVLAGLYQTNFMVKAIHGPVEIKQWVTRFQYTNCNAHETIYFGAHGAGLATEFRTNTNDGYNVTLGNGGGDTMLSFNEVKRNLLEGVFALFDDNYDQGATWAYKNANFSAGHITLYTRYTNEMVIGKYLMWNPRTGKLVVEADFKEPYDFEKHKVQFLPR